MEKMLRRIVGLALVALACASEATDARTPAAPREASSTLVFTSDRTGRHQLYVLDVDGNVDGGAPERVVASEREDRHPRWSPDGTRIAFESAGGGTRDVFVVDADGGNLRRVTASGAAGQPDWAPDGRRLVYVAFEDGAATLRVVDLEDGSDEPLGVEGRWPDWSPDGVSIAFSALVDGDEEVIVVRADGSGRRRISRREGEDSRPRWSPDGDELYYAESSTRTGASDVVVRVPAKGGTPRALEDRKALSRAYVDRSVATWGGCAAPGTGLVACASVRGGNADLYVVDPRTSRARRVTDDVGMDQDPDWRPR